MTIATLVIAHRSRTINTRKSNAIEPTRSAELKNEAAFEFYAIKSIASQTEAIFSMKFHFLQSPGLLPSVLCLHTRR